MELEHLFHSAGFLGAFQLLMISALFVPGVLGRPDIYRSLARSLAIHVVTFGPMGLLIYVLYKVSRLG